MVIVKSIKILVNFWILKKPLYVKPLYAVKNIKYNEEYYKSVIWSVYSENIKER